MGKLSSAIQVTDGPKYGAGRFQYVQPLRQPILVLHTIEGSLSYDTARRHESPPHLWYSPGRRELFQTVDLLGPAHALRHPAGTPETNNRGPCLQIELEGFARDTRNWPDEYYANIAQDVVRPLERFCQRAYGQTLVGGPSTRGLTYADERSPIGPLASTNSPLRMSASQWRQAHGIVGHMHVPYNSHWDPGNFRIDTLLQYLVDLDRPRELRLLPDGQRLLRGSDVRNWQATLVRLELLEENQVDGFFGPRTHDATRRLQSSMGLAPDGVVTAELARAAVALPTPVDAPVVLPVAPAPPPAPVVDLDDTTSAPSRIPVPVGGVATGTVTDEVAVAPESPSGAGAGAGAGGTGSDTASPSAPSAPTWADGSRGGGAFGGADTDDIDLADDAPDRAEPPEEIDLIDDANGPAAPAPVAAEPQPSPEAAPVSQPTTGRPSSPRPAERPEPPSSSFTESVLAWLRRLIGRN